MINCNFSVIRSCQRYLCHPLALSKLSGIIQVHEQLSFNFSVFILRILIPIVPHLQEQCYQSPVSVVSSTPNENSPDRLVSTRYFLSPPCPARSCCAITVRALRPRYRLPTLIAATKGIVEGRLHESLLSLLLLACSIAKLTSHALHARELEGDGRVITSGRP